MESRSQKCLRSSEDDVSRDRLSELPDEVIVHILSLMPTVDAVRTVLLRRFGNLWTFIHTLKLDILKPPNIMDYDFFGWQRDDDVIVWWLYSFVTHVLLLHRRPSIDIFHLCVEFGSSAVDVTGDMKMWLRFVLDRQAKEIKFCYLPHYGTPILPNFRSESLVTLELSHCQIGNKVQVNLRSLKKLFLDRCNIYDEAFQRFLSGCPSLQEVGIVDPDSFKKLSFSAPIIDKLSLPLTMPYYWDNPLLLDCPNLKSLDFETLKLLPDVVNVSSVRCVNVKQISRVELNDDRPSKLEMFLGKFEVDILKLSCCASENFLHAIRHLHTLQVRWKRVVLELGVLCQNCLKGIYHLMSSIELLEELVICTTKDFGVATDLLPSELPSPCLMPQLKTITLHGHVESWNHQLLVEVFRREPDVLRKLVIVPI